MASKISPKADEVEDDMIRVLDSNNNFKGSA